MIDDTRNLNIWEKSCWLGLKKHSLAAGGFALGRRVWKAKVDKKSIH